MTARRGWTVKRQRSGSGPRGYTAPPGPRCGRSPRSATCWPCTRRSARRGSTSPGPRRSGTTRTCRPAPSRAGSTRSTARPRPRSSGPRAGPVQVCRDDVRRLAAGLAPRRRLLRLTAYTDQAGTSPIQRQMELQARGGGGYALGALYAGAPTCRSRAGRVAVSRQVLPLHGAAAEVGVAVGGQSLAQFRGPGRVVSERAVDRDGRSVGALEEVAERRPSANSGHREQEPSATRRR